MGAACIHHGISLPEGAATGVHGGFLGVRILYASDLAQAFWTAIVAFGTCVVVTIIVSWFSQTRNESELNGLVYSLTPRLQIRSKGWYRQPEALAITVLLATLALNIWFF